MQYTQVVLKNGLCFKFWVIELPSRAISEILSVFQFNANYRKYSITLSHAQQKYSHRNAINEWNHHNYLDGKYGTHFCECQAVVRYSYMSAKAVRFYSYNLNNALCKLRVSCSNRIHCLFSMSNTTFTVRSRDIWMTRDVDVELSGRSEILQVSVQQRCLLNMGVNALIVPCSLAN